MNTKAHSVECVVTSATQEMLHIAESMARNVSKPDSVLTDVARTFPGGVETTTERQFRIADFFENVEIVEQHVDSDPTFRIVFHVRSGADQFWMDAISKILVVIRNAGSRIKSVRACA